MPTNVTTLTLAEETQLWISWAVGDHIEDVGKHTNVTLAGWALRDVLLMELALRGRVQMRRFKPLSHHSRYRRRPISRICRGIFCLFCLCLTVLNIPVFAPLRPFLDFILQELVGGAVGLYVALGFLDRALFRRRLVLVDATPTGDAILDHEMHKRFQTSWIQKLRDWLPSRVNSRSDDPFESIEQRLAGKGVLIAQPSEKWKLNPDGVVWRVNEASEAWQVLCNHIKSVLTGATLPDAQTVALLLLVTPGDLHPFTKRPKITAPVLTLVSREERAAAQQRLSQMLVGDQTLAAHVGETLYDTLLGIRDNRM